MKLKKCKYCNGTGRSVNKSKLKLTSYYTDEFVRCPKCYGKGVKS